MGLGCDGSSSADSASLWQEARLAMLQGKLVSGAAAMTARVALEIATRGGAGCLGRVGELGELSVGAVGDVAIWSLEGPLFAGVLDDPIEGGSAAAPPRRATRSCTAARWSATVRSCHRGSTRCSPAHRDAARRFRPS
ncbi:MAG: amidohydrolase family protein [Acidimicrobiales bacterium]